MELQRKTFLHSYKVGLTALLMIYKFSSQSLQIWTSAHLSGTGWYLESGPQHVSDLENDKFNSLEAASGKVLEGEA
jgi:hypothetical protein